MAKVFKNWNTAQLDLYHVKLTFIISCLAWPTVYLVHSITTMVDKTNVAISTIMLTPPMFLILYFVIRKLSKINVLFFYIFTILTFSSMGSLIMLLEIHGIISNFLSEYLTWVEPHLKSSWGIALLLFDATVYYAIYLLLAFSSSNRLQWRSLEIYWSAGQMCIILTTILSALAGKNDFRAAFFMNIPYLAVSAFMLMRRLNEAGKAAWRIKIPENNFPVLLDLILSLGFILSIGIYVSKGLIVFGFSNSAGITRELLALEPALLEQDPAPFRQIKSTIYLMVLVPMHFVSIFQRKLLKRQPKFLWSLAVIQAGIILPLQFIHIAAAIHPYTALQYRSDYSDSRFWLVNMTPIVTTHLLIYQLRKSFKNPISGFCKSK